MTGSCWQSYIYLIGQVRGDEAMKQGKVLSFEGTAVPSRFYLVDSIA